MTVALIGFAGVFVLLFLGVPISFGMAIAGLAGFGYLVGGKEALAMLGQIAYETSLSYSLTVIPLFVLMGNFISRSQLSTELYRAAFAFLGHLRGGLALATLVACAGFSAVCGSSLATAATMAKVAMPPMRTYRYADSLAAGTVAAGGTLGILIPPSVVLVLYGIMTNNDIGKLFIAGILPGMLGLAFYMLAAWLTARLRPALAPPGERTPWRGRLRALGGVWGTVALFVIVIGGIYFGIFTPTEAAGIGAGGALVFAVARRTLKLADLIDVLVETARMTAMIFAILIGAFIFSNFINVAGLPAALSGWVKGLGAEPLLVMVAILCIYVVLGCILESMSMLLLTVPIFYPIIIAQGFDPIWFGIIVVVVIEISLITPPIGLNVFVLKATLPDIKSGVIFRGVAPFIAADIVRLTALVLLPGTALLLPSFMK
jgi:tripartite ATP-independent transporter DctM subunit